VTELTGAAGDVFLLHPLLLHARRYTPHAAPASTLYQHSYIRTLLLCPGSKNLWRPSEAPAGGGAADSGVRVVAHPSVPLRRPLNLAAPRSVLERSIVGTSAHPSVTF